jgi:hypothetical protein
VGAGLPSAAVLCLGRRRRPASPQLDLALAKTTAITERVNLEFRVEYFNVLNHPEFAQPTSPNGNNNIDSATFGQIG